MTVTKTHPNGGTFTAQFPVQPRLTFAQVGNPANVRVLDTGAVGLPPLQFHIDPSDNAPWVHTVSPPLEVVIDPGTNFVPGIVDIPPEQRQLFHADARPDAFHTICPAFPSGACCYPDGTCRITQQPDCEATGGVWQGGGTDCGQITYPPPVVWPPGFIDIST